MARGSFALFNYDIPVSRKSDYNRVRKATKRFSLMQSWSCYVIPLAMKEIVDDLFTELNNNGGARITYSILKFDDSTEETILEMARKGVGDLIMRLQEKMYGDIAKMQQKLDEEGEDVDMTAVRRVSARKAKKKLEEAQALAAVFLIAPDIEGAVQSAFKKIEAQLAWEEADKTENGEETAEVVEAIA